MFGYIVVHQPELKVREYETYRAAYCGLCRSLKNRHGRLGQMTLSFDMTFLALLLSGLYEPETVSGCGRCLAHPMQKHHYLSNPYYDYAADMNLLLTYYKCLDDWQDERKFTRLIFAKFLGLKMPKIRRLYGQKTEKIGRLLEECWIFRRDYGRIVRVPQRRVGREASPHGIFLWKIYLPDGCLRGYRGRSEKGML